MKRSIWLFGLLFLVSACGTSDSTTRYSFSSLKSEYNAYNRNLPFNEVIEYDRDNGNSEDITVIFDTHDAQRAFIFLSIPKNTPSMPLLIGEDTNFFQDEVDAKGVMTMQTSRRLDHPTSIEGWVDDELWTTGLATLIWSRKNTIIDHMRALDYVLENYDIDTTKILYAGTSTNGIIGAILTAVDNRVDSAILRSMGSLDLFIQNSDDDRFNDVLDQPWYSPEIFASITSIYEPKHFVAAISPRPLYFQFGANNTLISLEAYTDLYERALEPKSQTIYDSGHSLSNVKVEAGRDALEFMAEQWSRPDLLD